MFQEFPKWVYPDGDAARGVLVHSAEQEAALLPKVETKTYEDDTQAIGPAPLPAESPAEPVKRKPGRPRKEG